MMRVLACALLTLRAEAYVASAKEGLIHERPVHLLRPHLRTIRARSSIHQVTQNQMEATFGQVKILGRFKGETSLKTNITVLRCGFNWDDAAAKASPSCTKDYDCIRPEHADWPADANYSCYADVPDTKMMNGDCVAVADSPWEDSFCESTCGVYWGAWCDPDKCSCTKGTDAWNLSAAIPPHDTAKVKSLPVRSDALAKRHYEDYDNTPSGIPACIWRPSEKSKCSNVSVYECTQGNDKGKCAKSNFFGKSTCERSCVHERLLRAVPYYAVWNSGPLADPFILHERFPRYKHDVDPRKYTSSDVLMSNICKSKSQPFVAITLYTSKYVEKAERWVHSCERVGACCKATRLAGNAFGSAAPEGSEAFRFKIIAMKPSFMLSQMDLHDMPVVYMDGDMEFQRYPNLFLPGSWPNGDRDVLLYNYWGNETDPDTKKTQNIGSAVCFFNSTTRARRVLGAWAEAMAYSSNAMAPDDQVLDTLLKEGLWIKRASYGYLPTSYSRTMPSFYRGIDPVIEHDHGSAPGLLAHSEAKPVLPPVASMELCEKERNTGRKLQLSPSLAIEEAKADVEGLFACKQHGECDVDQLQIQEDERLEAVKVLAEATAEAAIKTAELQKEVDIATAKNIADAEEAAKIINKAAEDMKAGMPGAAVPAAAVPAAAVPAKAVPAPEWPAAVPEAAAAVPEVNVQEEAEAKIKADAEEAAKAVAKATEDMMPSVPEETVPLVPEETVPEEPKRTKKKGTKKEETDAVPEETVPLVPEETVPEEPKGTKTAGNEKNCYSAGPGSTDAWCAANCNFHNGAGLCPASLCTCD